MELESFEDRNPEVRNVSYPLVVKIRPLKI